MERDTRRLRADPIATPRRHAARAEPAPSIEAVGGCHDLRHFAIAPPHSTVQRKAATAPVLPSRGGGGAALPEALRHEIEALGGVAMDDTRVFRNSAEPAALGAHAFARGTEIHLAPAQEYHLAHEAWHVVQQKRGRVRTTGRVGGMPLNDDVELEREADRMGQAATVRAKGAVHRP